MLIYYALHSAKNQAIKFVRTWAFVLLLVVMVLGGAAVFAARWYLERLEEANMPTPDDMLELLAVSGLTTTNALELVLGLVVLGIVVLQLIGAEKSTARLFMQADVNMLFPSPRSPQGILAFRVATTLSLALVAVVPQLFSIPSLQRQWGIGAYAALTLPVAWCLTLGFSALLKMLAFELGSRYRFVRQNLRWFLLGALALVGIVFYRAYDTAAEQNLLVCAHQMFNAGWTRAIPVWGWIKGMVVYAFEGRTDLSLGLLCLNVLFMAALGVVVARTKADYYEETLGWAEDVARFREELASDNAALVILEVSQRGGKTRGEGFDHGLGASVYFHKVLHQRRRFARYGFVTKTMMTYLFAAVAAGLFVRFFMEDALPYIPALLLVAMVFFRTVISPVTEDVRKDSFLLLPEPIWSKLFFSLAGGSVNCALDVVVPLIAGSVAAGFSPLEGLLYLPVLVLADFFASASGVFADVSIPPSIGVSLKQVAKVLLLYCGLIFDGMVLTYGLGAGDIVLGFVLASFINLLFGAVFLGLAGVWLHPRHGLPARQEAKPVDLADARSAYTRVGLAMAAMFVAVYGGRYLMSGWAPSLVATYLPLYVLGPVAFLLLVGRRGATPPDRDVSVRKLRVVEVLALVPACLFAAYFGNILGFILQWILHFLPSVNLLPEVGAADGNLALQVAFATVASPVMEEFVFRRCLIDRLSPFGERAALVVSAVAFGLFHGTANQLCYATLLGLVFGYVYLRTRRLRYTVGVHMAINILSSVVLSALLFGATNAMYNNDPNMMMGAGNLMLSEVMSEPAVLALVVYVTMLVVLALLGVVLFAYGVSERRIMPGGIGVAQAFSTFGVVVFLVLSVAALL